MAFTTMVAGSWIIVFTMSVTVGGNILTEYGTTGKQDFRGDTRVRAFDCFNPRTNWRSYGRTSKTNCVYATQDFSKENHETVSIINYNPLVEFLGEYCEGILVYEFHRCSFATPFSFAVKTGESSQPLVFTKEECSEMHKSGIYRLDHFKYVGLEKSSVITVSGNDAPHLIKVSGEMREDATCKYGDDVIMNPKEKEYKSYQIVVAKVRIKLDIVTLKVYPGNEKKWIHYGNYKVSLTNEGWIARKWTIVYNVSETELINSYRQKTFYNVTIMRMNQTKQHYLGTGSGGYLEFEMSKSKKTKISLGNDEKLPVIKTSIPGVYVCIDCPSIVKKIKVMRPGTDEQLLETKLQVSQGGIKLRLLKENVMILENRICLIQRFLTMSSPEYPLIKELKQGVQYEIRNGIPRYRECQAVEVNVNKGLERCYEHVPVVYKGYSFYLEYNTNILLRDSKVRECKDEMRNVYRITTVGGEEVDICGAPRFNNCTVGEVKPLNDAELYNIDEFGTGNLFTEKDYEEKSREDDGKGRVLVESDYPTISVVGGGERQGAIDGISIIIEAIKDEVLKIFMNIPVVGWALGFVFSYSLEEKTKIFVLIVSGLDVLRECVVHRRLNLVLLIIMILCQICPALYFYIKIVSSTNQREWGEFSKCLAPIVNGWRRDGGKRDA